MCNATMKTDLLKMGKIDLREFVDVVTELKRFGCVTNMGSRAKSICSVT